MSDRQPWRLASPFPKLCISFTLRLLAWFGVFLAISKNQPREKGMFFLLRKIFCNRSEKRQESGARWNAWRNTDVVNRINQY